VNALFLSLALTLGQSDEAKAKALYKEGEAAYNLSQFEAALAKYSDAYKLKTLPGFLFNIAQCHKQLQQYERAAFFYGRFIDTSPPKAPNVELAKSLLEEMKQRDVASKEAAAKADEKKKADEDALAKQKANDELKQVQLAPAEPMPQPTFVPPPAPPAVVAQDEPVYTKGWFWGVVAGAVVVVAAGTTVAVIVASPKPRTPSLGDLR
jgi:tetratricopeptide (TPR) repeat protein